MAQARQGGHLFGAGGGPAAPGKGGNAHGARAVRQGRGCLPRERRKDPGTPGKPARGHTTTHTRAVP